MKTPALLLPIVAIALSLGACDQAKHEENKAKEAKADAIEDVAKAKKEAADAKAHETKAQGAAEEKALKKEADAVRDTKQNP
jgi:hypothetical protein